LYEDTIFHIAARHGHLQFLKTIIAYVEKKFPEVKKTPFLDIQNNQEKLTPLGIAVLKEQYEMAEFLMDHRCDIYFKNSDGETPTSIAIKYGLNRIAEEIPKLQKNGGYKSLKKATKK